MTQNWLDEALPLIAAGTAVMRCIVLSVKGSAPRDVGAEMLVMPEHQSGTIGGGALEYQAASFARERLASLPETGFMRDTRAFALGPDLGQCCGGYVVVLFEGFGLQSLPALQKIQQEKPIALCHEINSQALPSSSEEAAPAPLFDKDKALLFMPHQPAKRPLYIYGAGHVGRALINTTNELALERIWVDSAPSRFPAHVPDDVRVVTASDMAVIARYAPEGAIHIIVTYSHQFDEAITHALLKAGNFGHIGLIGSQTKKARFDKRFLAAGLPEALIARVQCPVGLPDIKDKAPAHVALSIAGQIAVWLEEA